MVATSPQKPPASPPLGDEHVGALPDGALGLFDAVHLGHEERARVVRARR
jgi:hypothetical protein